MPQIVVLAELWIGSDEINLYNIAGFQSLSKCKDQYRAGGGICFVDCSVEACQLTIDMVTADAVLLNIKIDNAYFRLLCF